MHRTFFCLALIVATGLAHAASAPLTTPSLRDLDARLPDTVVGLQRLPSSRLEREDKRLAAQYEAPRVASGPGVTAPPPVTRASVFVLPVVQSSVPPLGRVTVRAQIAMLDATVDNLRRGTAVLGEGYQTGLARTATLQAGVLNLVCSAITRSQHPDLGELKLLDRRCFFEMPGYVVGVTVSTPFHGVEQAAREDQFAFIMAASRALVE